MSRTFDYCEHCGVEKEAEFVDIGIGSEQVTSAVCPNNCDYIAYLESLEKEDEQ